MQKLLGLIINTALVLTVGTAFYRSATEPSAPAVALSPPSAVPLQSEPTSAPAALPHAITLRANHGITPASLGTRPTAAGAVPAIAPLKGFFDGKLTPGTKLHIVGIYEPADRNDDGIPWWQKCRNLGLEAGSTCSARTFEKQGLEVDVAVSYTKAPVVIALMAYSATTWNVEVASGVNLQGIVLAGYHNQTLKGVPRDLPVIAHVSKDAFCGDCVRGSGYFYAYQQDADYAGAAVHLYQSTGLQPASFQGGYRAWQFNISNQLD